MEQGYLVIRSAASKGIADLVALKKGEVVLVDVKFKRRPGPKDRERLKTTAEELGVRALSVYGDEWEWI